MMQISESQRWFGLALLLLTGWLFYLLAPILTPFFIAGLLAYLGDPLVDRLEKHKLSRTVAVIIVFLVMTLLLVLAILLLVPLLQQQISQLIHVLPDYIAWISNNVVPWLENNFGISHEQLNLAAVSAWITQHWATAGGVAVNILEYASRSGGMLLGWAANIVLIPVVGFYLLRDWDHFIAGIDHLLPRKIEPEIAHIAREADSMLSAFLRGQLTVMMALGTIYAVGLAMTGLKFALLIGLLAGVVSFVPYLGFIVGIVVAGVAMLMQTHDPMQLVWVVAVFGVGQMAEGMLLTPLLVGDKIGLHPVTVIFSVLAGGQLFGFMGVLLALPVAAVLAVIVRDLQRRYLESQLYAAEHVVASRDQDPPQ
jgi:predicted PurR-regulated permease PerM